MDQRTIKMCMVVHSFYERDGRVRRYAETLSTFNHQVDVICLRGEGQPHFNVMNGVRIFRIPFGYRSKERHGYLLEYGVSFFLFTIWLFMLFFRHRYHIIHIHNMPDFLIFTAFVPRIFGAKLIIDIHDPMPEFYLCKYQVSRNSLSFQLLQLQERLSAAFAHAVIVANHLFKENISKRGIAWDKITVVNNVPEEKIFDRTKYTKDPDRRNHDFTLIYVGTVARRYGLDVPIRALPTLTTQIPQIHLKIIGSQRDGAKELSLLAEQLGVAPYIHFLPPIPIDEIPYQLIQADIGIYTAQPDPHMSIATPTKVLEYTAIGLPTVASRLPILEELYAEGSIQFFEPGNPEDFARKIIELYKNPKRREELVRSADQSFPLRLSWQREWASYLNLIKQLIENDHESQEPIMKEVA